MKQTRRKELKTNELGAWLQQTYGWIEQNSTYMLSGVLAVVAILVIGLLIQQRRLSTQQTAWNTYYELREKDVSADPEALERVRGLASAWGTNGSLGPAVLQLKGTMEARLAMTLSDPKDRDRKVQLLKDASSTYQQMLEQFGKRPEAAAEARISLAGIEESLTVLKEGSTDKVRQYYQQLVETKPNTYADLAASRLADLDQRLRPIEILATRPAETSPAPTMIKPSTRPAATQAGAAPNLALPQVKLTTAPASAPAR